MINVKNSDNIEKFPIKINKVILKRKNGANENGLPPVQKTCHKTNRICCHEVEKLLSSACH